MINITIHKNTIVKILILFLVCIITFYIQSIYINGDQIRYIKVYETLKNLNLKEGFCFYKSEIGSIEIIHFFLIWLFSHLGISKVIFDILINAVLANFAIDIMQKMKVNNLIISILILTNFYFYVLFFSAERLKIAFIFLEMYLLYFLKNKKINIYFILLTVLSHLQTIIIYISMMFSDMIVKLFKFKKLNKKYIFFILFIPFFLIYFYNYLIYKINFYILYYPHDFNHLIKPIVFLLLSLVVSKDKIKTFIIFIPIIFSTLIVGSERVTIFAYFIFLYNALQYKKGLNILIFLTTGYYFYKTIVFIHNVYLTGQGF